jgi:hypothetical protein
VIKNYCHPTLIKIALAGHDGNANPTNTRRSFVAGIQEYSKEYSYSIPKDSFVITLPNEAIAMAAAVVRFDDLIFLVIHICTSLRCDTS